jgi:hypothetical protein
MLSSGVVLPDRRLRMMKTGGAASPNCGIELTWVPGCIAIDFVAHLVHLTAKITRHLEV